MTTFNESSSLRTANSIAMFSIATKIRSVGNPLIDLAAVEIPPSVLSNILAVTPAKDLLDYRFIFVGNEIEERLGLHLDGLKFSELLAEHQGASGCLAAFRTAIEEQRVVSCYRKTDFSASWVIEYSRTIVPIFADGELCYLLAGYVFHDRPVVASAL